jgi:hypothetical protein
LPQLVFEPVIALVGTGAAVEAVAGELEFPGAVMFVNPPGGLFIEDKYLMIDIIVATRLIEQLLFQLTIWLILAL